MTNTPSGTQQPLAKPTFVPGSTTLRDYANVPDNVFYFPNPALPLSDIPDSVSPLWQSGTPMEISVYVDENEYFTDYEKKPDWKTTGMIYGEDFEPREHRIDIPTTKVRSLDMSKNSKLNGIIDYSK